jgi:teichuronic acid biosynthesis glycosyltransferase TuaC
MRSPPQLVVLSSLFPSRVQPLAGVFVKERMVRVGKLLPVTVVSPQPWFPGQGLLRLFVRGYRPPRPSREEIDGVEVRRPRFLALPGVLRRLDGWSMALACLPLLRRARREGRLDVIDAHFGYPDGRAAALLGRWLDVPVAITLRGTEVRHEKDAALRGELQAGLLAARRVFSVSSSLRDVALRLGVASERTRVVGNGVDLARFAPREQAAERQRLGLPIDAKVLISVGGLVERKGFHRVIEMLPRLREQFANLHYLIVGGPSPEGDLTAELKRQVGELGLGHCVHFLGPMAPEQLAGPLSAADVFVLATRNEGWANVFLEAMACGLPVVATDVGGNAEVVCQESLGSIVPFGDPQALAAALAASLQRSWDRTLIRHYAEQNTWDSRVAVLRSEFETLHDEHRRGRTNARGPAEVAHE